MARRFHFLSPIVQSYSIRGGPLHFVICLFQQNVAVADFGSSSLTGTNVDTES